MLEGYDAQTQTMTAVYWGLFDSNAMGSDGELRRQVTTGVTSPEGMGARFLDSIVAATDPVGQVFGALFGGFFQVVADNVELVLIVLGVTIGLQMIQKMANKAIRL